MKRLLFAGLLALGLVLTSHQQASAWSKWSFNAGISLNCESGNSSWLWGLHQNGQVPGYPTDYRQGATIVAPPNPYVAMGGGQGYGGFDGGYPGMGYAGMQGGPALPGNAQPMPSGTQPQQPKQNETQAVYYSGYNYQPAANYQTPNYSYPQYSYPQYSSPSYGYGNYQVPSYWYGR